MHRKLMRNRTSRCRIVHTSWVICHILFRRHPLDKNVNTLERFRAFHENLESISEDSRASMNRVIRWLKGGN